jgi:hypothetical protein
MNADNGLNLAATVDWIKLPLPLLNSQAPWHRFDSNWYQDQNYRCLRDDDRQIIQTIRDYWTSTEVLNGHGIDVGAGANLYPSLAMLPFCRALDLWEFSPPNVDWLDGQVKQYDANWDEFWTILEDTPPYARVPNPRRALAEKASVRRGSVFDLPTSRWDLGSMFFVACSMSTEIREFYRAVECFVRSLKPNAPFAAAFMASSSGYVVDAVEFPAVYIGADEVARSLAQVAYDVDIHWIETDSPLRPGYAGMILALGRANPDMTDGEHRV